MTQHNAGPSGRINVNAGTHIRDYDAMRLDLNAKRIGYAYIARMMHQLTDREWEQEELAVRRNLGIDVNPHSDCLPVLDEIVEAGDDR